MGELPAGVTHWDGPPLDAWDAWRPEEAAAHLTGVGIAWCVVGGWAIDLFLGHQTRSHDDLEICIPRSAFEHVRSQLSDFVMHVVGGGEVRALEPGALPPPSKHQNWVLDPGANAWRMDVMLDPGNAETWIFRRDERIRRPRAAMTGVRDGVPFLRPEGVLLYKAKAVRPKDEADFAAVLSKLSEPALGWLCDVLARVHPDHAWLAPLRATAEGRPLPS